MANPLAPGTACTECGNLVYCVCKIKKEHGQKCHYRRAAALSVELECPHGYQACTICDPCTCGSTAPIYNLR